MCVCVCVLRFRVAQVHSTSKRNETNRIYCPKMLIHVEVLSFNFHWKCKHMAILFLQHSMLALAGFCQRTHAHSTPKICRAHTLQSADCSTSQADKSLWNDVKYNLCNIISCLFFSVSLSLSLLFFSGFSCVMYVNMNIFSANKSKRNCVCNTRCIECRSCIVWQKLYNWIMFSNFHLYVPVSMSIHALCVWKSTNFTRSVV